MSELKYWNEKEDCVSDEELETEVLKLSGSRGCPWADAYGEGGDDPSEGKIT